MAKKTAEEKFEDLLGQLAELGTEREDEAKKEVRTYLGREIENQFTPTGVGRAAYGGTSHEIAIKQALREFPSMQGFRMQEALHRMESTGGIVSEDFVAGIVFAALLVQDLTYEY